MNNEDRKRDYDFWAPFVHEKLTVAIKEKFGPEAEVENLRDVEHGKVLEKVGTYDLDTEEWL